MVEKLTNVDTTKSLDSSIPATATRTLVVSFPRPVGGIPPSKEAHNAYSAISKVLVPRLLGYIVIPHGIKGLPDPPPGMLSINPVKGVDAEAIDLLYEVIRCFGPMLQEAEKQAFQRRLMEILDDPRTGNVTKKKAVAAISILAIYMPEVLLNNIVLQTVERFRDSHLAPAQRRLLITMVGSVARSIPRRFGQYLKTIAPFVLSALSQPELDETTGGNDEDGLVDPQAEEVKESALIALDDFLSSCSDDMRMFSNDAITASLRYIDYNPSLAMEEDDEDMGGTQDEDEEEPNDDDDSALDDDDEEYEEEEVMSDSDDASWKIRRCAAKVLYTIISRQGDDDLLENGTLYERVAPALIRCFKEREENVRLEILATLAALVRTTGKGTTAFKVMPEDEVYASATLSFKSRKRRRGGSDASMFDAHVPSQLSKGTSSPAESSSGPRAALTRLGGSIVRNSVKLLKQKSIPTRQAVTTLLRDFTLVQHGGLRENLGQILGPVVENLKAASPLMGGSSIISFGGAASATGVSLRIESLYLVRAITDTHSTPDLLPFMKTLTPGLVSAITDRYFKVSSEAIYVSESVIRALTPPRASGNEQGLADYLNSIFEAVLEKARANDTDLEVRQCAIHALGMILAQTSAPNASGLLSKAKRAKATDVLLERLRNETTRIATVKAIDVISLSTINQGDLKPDWIRGTALELANQLRKSDRVLRSSSLATLGHLLANQAAIEGIDAMGVKILADLVLPILDVNNLALLGPALNVLTDLVRWKPKQVVSPNLNKALCEIVISPLAGNVLESFLALVSTIGTQGAGKPLMDDFLKNVGVAGDPTIVGSAIGTLLVSGGKTVGVTIRDILTELQTAQDDQRKCLALAILGEASLLLGSSSPVQPNTFLDYFRSKSEQVPRAAALALGRAGAGNGPLYLPIILSQMDKSGSSQLLLLQSVKEILESAARGRTEISAHTDALWEKLGRISQAEDNKAVGAECIGRLAGIEPKKYLPQLQVSQDYYRTVTLHRLTKPQDYLQDSNVAARATAIQALRFAFTDADESFDDALKPIMTKMLTTMLKDPELENRRLALITLNSATQNKPSLILPHLSQLLPFVIEESKLNPSLVREVQMGPFKHKVDDGLEIRKVISLHLVQTP